MKDVNGVAVIDFVESGLMFEAALIHEIGEESHGLLIDHGRGRTLLDFTRVRYLTSSMPGQLARLARDVASARGRLKITGPGPVSRVTFRIGHFEPLFAIYDDKASALKAFR